MRPCPRGEHHAWLWAIAQAGPSCCLLGRGELQRLQDASTAVLERLMGLEAEVKYVSTELRAEKLLWSSRYLELLREQQELREQVGLRQTPQPHGCLPSVPGGGGLSSPARPFPVPGVGTEPGARGQGHPGDAEQS